MRTHEEIIERYRATQDSDFFGFAGSILLSYLPVDMVREFCKPDADLSAWKPGELSEDAVREEMRDYMQFAWGKVEDHRGLSAGRSIQKMTAWLWLLGDDDLVKFAEDDANYQNYGAPVLAAISRKYGFPIPEDAGVQRMIQGLPCEPDCDGGCAK